MLKRISVIILAALLIVAFVQPAEAQITPTVVKLATAKAYGASQSDTSKSVRVAAGTVISSRIYVRDSVSVYRTIQYCKSSASYSDPNWTLAKKDTITTTAAGYSELVLRNGTTDNIGGVAGWTRVILDFQATANGVTSATYDNEIYVK